MLRSCVLGRYRVREWSPCSTYLQMAFERHLLLAPRFTKRDDRSRFARVSNPKLHISNFPHFTEL